MFDAADADNDASDATSADAADAMTNRKTQAMLLYQFQ